MMRHAGLIGYAGLRRRVAAGERDEGLEGRRAAERSGEWVEDER
jgi:hypothetical protein